MSPVNTASVHSFTLLDSISRLAVDSCTVIETDGIHEESMMDTLPLVSSMQTLYLMWLVELIALMRNMSEQSTGNTSELMESVLSSIVVSMLDQ